jgi:putative transposase
MGKRGHSEEEILRVLREAESGETVVEVCRKHGISQQGFYLWKKKYAGLGLNELREPMIPEPKRRKDGRGHIGAQPAENLSTFRTGHSRTRLCVVRLHSAASGPRCAIGVCCSCPPRQARNSLRH